MLPPRGYGDALLVEGWPHGWGGCAVGGESRAAVVHLARTFAREAWPVLVVERVATGRAEAEGVEVPEDEPAAEVWLARGAVWPGGSVEALAGPPAEVYLRCRSVLPQAAQCRWLWLRTAGLLAAQSPDGSLASRVPAPTAGRPSRAMSASRRTSSSAGVAGEGRSGVRP